MQFHRFLTGLSFFLAASAALAQPQNSPANAAYGGQRGFVVRGEVSSDHPSLGSLSVELASRGEGVPEIVPVNPDGSFEFRSATPGSYQLRITGAGGGVLHEERVYISGPNDHLSVRLPDSPNASRAAGASISIRQLQHKVPPEALKAFTKGQSAAKKGNVQDAVEQFQAALRIDPEFAEAHNDLGAERAAQGDLSQAAEEFQKAVDLVPDHRLALANLCIVLAKLKQFGEAVAVGRRVLKLDPSNSGVHLILALSLMATRGDPAEALDHTQKAAAEIPMARVAAAELLLEIGKRVEAVQQLQEYLHTAPPEDVHRPKVEALLAQLQE
jgi:tetratricopeptide (TPR) repeat protein